MGATMELPIRPCTWTTLRKKRNPKRSHGQMALARSRSSITTVTTQHGNTSAPGEQNRINWFLVTSCTSQTFLIRLEQKTLLMVKGQIKVTPTSIKIPSSIPPHFLSNTLFKIQSRNQLSLAWIIQKLVLSRWLITNTFFFSPQFSCFSLLFQWASCPIGCYTLKALQQTPNLTPLQLLQPNQAFSLFLLLLLAPTTP